MIRTIAQILGSHPMNQKRRRGTPQRPSRRPHAVPDHADAEQLNRYTWYQTRNWTKPYPGDKKVCAPDDVPGAYLPAPESDG
jgi:hypothetical protein